MGKIVYIHGFNGDCRGRTTSLLSARLKADIVCLGYDYSRPFPECLQELERMAANLAGGELLLVLAVSLGAFYAMQLRQPPLVGIVAWNPVIFPAIQLRQFLGENTRFFDGHKWRFSEEALYSYAEAPDPRQWDNFHFQATSCAQKNAPGRTIFLGRNDELLDAALAYNFWRGHAVVRWIDAGHDVNDFSHLKNFHMRAI